MTRGRGLMLLLALGLSACGPPEPSREQAARQLRDGRAALSRGDAAGAVPALAAAVQLLPEAADPLAVAAKHAGAQRTALRAVASALDRQPGQPQLLAVAASLEIDLEELGAAEKNLRAVLEVSPGDHQATLLLARLKVQANRPEDALAILLEHEPVALGPQTSPRNAAVFLTDLGQVLLMLGRTDDALAGFEDAIRRDPRHANAHYGVGLARLARRELPEAATAFAAARQQAPDHLEAVYQAMNVAEQLGREAEATEARERFASLYRARLLAVGALDTP